MGLCKEWAAFVYVHSRDHADQIEKVKAAPRFPRQTDGRQGLYVSDVVVLLNKSGSPPEPSSSKGIDSGPKATTRGRKLTIQESQHMHGSCSARRR